jgi:hypothetical protein
MDQKLVDAIRRLVQDLADARYEAIAADGRGGRLPADEMRQAVSSYGRTLVSLPSDVTALIDMYPNSSDPDTCALDVALWTAEEGRSDLTLSLTATRSRDGYRIEIDALHVL